MEPTLLYPVVKPASTKWLKATFTHALHVSRFPKYKNVDGKQSTRERLAPPYMPIRLDVHPSPEPYFLSLPFLSKHVLHSISLKGRTLTKYISKTRYQDLFDRYVGREHILSCSPKLMRIFTGRPLSSLARATLKMALPQAMKHSFGFTDFRPTTCIVVSCKAGRNGSSSSHELLGNLGKTHLHQSFAKASRTLKDVHDL